MTYKKVGGLHFITIGRYGASFYTKRGEGYLIPTSTLAALAAMPWVATIILYFAI